MIVSARSHLTAGLAAALVAGAVGTAAVAPPTDLASPAVQLTTAAELTTAVQLAATVAPLLEPDASAGVSESPGDWIINAYSVVQPWVEYGVELFAWATEWLPWPIGLLAPQTDIIYGGWQPFAESVVYSFAYLVDGQFDLIVPTLTAGIQTGVTNLVQGEIAWFLSFFPPLPPIGAAAAAATRTVAARTAQPAAASTENTTMPAETAPAQPAVALSNPGPLPKQRAVRGAARAPRPVPAAAAATGMPPVSSETTAANHPKPQVRKASRDADARAGAVRAQRAAR